MARWISACGESFQTSFPFCESAAAASRESGPGSGWATPAGRAGGIPAPLARRPAGESTPEASGRPLLRRGSRALPPWGAAGSSCPGAALLPGWRRLAWGGGARTRRASPGGPAAVTRSGVVGPQWLCCRRSARPPDPPAAAAAPKRPRLEGTGGVRARGRGGSPMPRSGSLESRVGGPASAAIHFLLFGRAGPGLPSAPLSSPTSARRILRPSPPTRFRAVTGSGCRPPLGDLPLEGPPWPACLRCDPTQLPKAGSAP